MTTQITRRSFVAGAAGVVGTIALQPAFASAAQGAYDLVAKVDRARILNAAQRFLGEQPVTVMASHSDRTQGGKHDYFSEGDYWWPDAKNPGGPYIRRDGFSNPANFNDNREALIRLSLIAPALAAAWRLTGDKRYSTHFVKHLRAWFVDPATKMNPNLEYAQAIFGVSKGRGTGIIDTLHLVEVVRAIRVLEARGGISVAEMQPIRTWFADYVGWMATSQNGKDEETAKNNHGTCWVLQAAEFSQFARRPDLTSLCRDRFKAAIVPDQIDRDGSLPLELARTKPYSYALFDTDVLSGICESLSTKDDNLWTFKGPNGKGVADALAFVFPYIADKSKWPFAKDVEYFDDLPARRPSLLFAGEALGRAEYIEAWRTLDPDPKVPEVIRNMPIRQPLLWMDTVLRG
ncbi:MAG: alginate lyase family protein [Acidobacteriota bacterium]|nr:alginate lyase family protein [Acidobacteriota bacterium]